MLRLARIPAVVVALAFLWCGERIALGQTRPPNIVLIVADDMGYADIGIHGSKDIPTPNIDALATAGVRFTDAYVTGPYCSPTRAGLLTGRYPQRFGHEFNLGPSGPFGLPLTETTIADRLREAGYRTALFGKWHLGAGERFHPHVARLRRVLRVPRRRAFVSGHRSSECRSDSRWEKAGNGHDVSHRRACRSRSGLHSSREGASLSPLSGVQRRAHADACNGQIPRQVREHCGLQRRTYAAMLSAMDDAIGRTIATLRAETLEENTLVIFFSDNGGPTMAGTTINGSSNGPLRGSKRQTWKGASACRSSSAGRGTFQKERLTRGRSSSSTCCRRRLRPPASHSEANHTLTVSTWCRLSLARIRVRCTRHCTGASAG